MKKPIDNFICEEQPEGSVAQWFGMNPALYAHLNLAGHNGHDYVAPWGSNIYAVKGGLVVEVKDSPTGYGKHVRILTDFVDDIAEEWTYGHASENLVKVGDRVEEGQLIQKMGNTGYVVSGATPFWKYNPYAGTHLHLGKRLLKKSKVGWSWNGLTPLLDVVDYNNGYLGAVDFRDEISQLDNDLKVDKLLTIKSLANQVIDLYTKIINMWITKSKNVV